VTHYCVATMPGAYARTATQALTNVTYRYIEMLADLGLAEACQKQPAWRAGINVMDGKVTHKAWAEAHGMPWQAVADMSASSQHEQPRRTVITPSAGDGRTSWREWRCSVLVSTFILAAGCGVPDHVGLDAETVFLRARYARAIIGITGFSCWRRVRLHVFRRPTGRKAEMTALVYGVCDGPDVRRVWDVAAPRGQLLAAGERGRGDRGGGRVRVGGLRPFNKAL